MNRCRSEQQKLKGINDNKVQDDVAITDFALIDAFKRAIDFPCNQSSI